MKEYAVVWNHTNNRGLVQLPMLCSAIKVNAEDEDDAIENAIMQVIELIVKQFPSFKCVALRDQNFELVIEVTENDNYIGRIDSFKAIS